MTGNFALRLGLAAMAAAYVIGFLQIFAAYAGIRVYTDWHWTICAPLAVSIGWTPLVGTIIGVYGAVKGWGWHWLPASLLFGWMLLLLPVFIRARASSARA